MCGLHWRRLPGVLKERVRDAYAHGRGKGTPEHRAALIRKVAQELTGNAPHEAEVKESLNCAPIVTLSARRIKSYAGTNDLFIEIELPDGQIAEVILNLFEITTAIWQRPQREKEQKA
jgi:hypothetical protein